MNYKDKKRQQKLNRNSSGYNQEPERTEENMSPPESADVATGCIDDYSDIHSKDNISTSMNNLRSEVHSLTQMKFAKQDDVRDVLKFVIDTRKKIDDVDQKLYSVAKSNELIRAEGNIKGHMRSVLSEVQNVGGTVESLDKKFNNLPNRNELSSFETRIKGAVNSEAKNLQRDINGLRTAVFDESGQSTIKTAKNILKAQRDFREDTSQRFDGLETTLKGIAANTEMIQSLPGKIDGISKILTDKGLQLKQDFPTVNHDEETLAELAECGEKILQQLSIAARWYARKLPELNAHENAIKNLEEANSKAVKAARKEGEEQGRKAVIEELLGAYDDLHKLMNPTDDTVLEQLKTLATFLSNAGVEPIYQQGQELEITEGNLISYEHNIANLKPGKIVITSPGYTFNSKTLEKAKYVSAEEFYAAQEISELQSEDGFYDEDSPELEFDFSAATETDDNSIEPPEYQTENNSTGEENADNLNATEADDNSIELPEYQTENNSTGEENADNLNATEVDDNSAKG